ncbi:glutathione S-transferase family protein [Vreelandella neptunia]|uniref:Glutathione S-transferase family protein n=1 Tax=Vreelandella neptunia TaxID=115551 RepID=A0ABS9S359_9GAMM|nr:glutathione S-transferase family protein [Halomonas neptunia]
MTNNCKLYYASMSPFVRKARIVAREVGWSLDLISVFASPIAPPEDLVRVNPLAKIPALRIPTGEVLFDSPVICRYLGEGTELYPTELALWRALRREALADGLIEAALLARYETTLRPEPRRWSDWVESQMGKVARCLEVMSHEVGDAEEPDIGDIATGCALAYLDFRYPQLTWRTDFPALAAFAEALNKRPAFQDTQPK